MEQIERITHYENILDRLNTALSALDAALEEYEAVQPGRRTLEEYYTGPLWRADLADDEAGRLPADLKRGVLSEDAVYDALEEDRAALVKLLRTAAAILEG